MTARDWEYWTPHEFYEDAAYAERQQRQRQQELRRAMTPLTYAVRSARASEMYPGLSSGVLAALGLSGADPTSSLYASISAQDLIENARSVATGSTSPVTLDDQERATTDAAGIAAGDLPIVDNSPWVTKLGNRDDWWAPFLAKPANVVQNLVQGFLLIGQAGYDQTFGYRAFAEAALERNPNATVISPMRTLANQMMGIETPEGVIESPVPIAMRIVEQWKEGEPVNIGDTWFLASGNLSPETRVRLEAGVDFDIAIDNAAQREMGVPLGYEYNAQKAAYPFHFRNGQEVPNSFGASVVTDIFDANHWGSKAASVVIDMGAATVSDPFTYIGGVSGGIRASGTRILAVGTKGIGMTMPQYLKTPGAIRALRGLRSLADNPMAINRAISRATRVADPAVAQAIGVAAKQGDDVLRDLLIHLSDQGAIANTFEPISTGGYMMRKAFLRGLREDGSASAVSRMTGAILERTAGSNAIPTVGSALAGLGIRSQAAQTMRHVGSIGGGWIGVKSLVDFRPGFARLVGNVARTLPVGNGADFVGRLDDYARSFGLSIDQRNALFSRASLQPEIRATMPMSKSVDEWAMSQIAKGNDQMLEIYGDLLLGGGMESENPLSIVEDVYRYFTQNAANATGMGASEQVRLNSLLSRIYKTTEDMRKYALELNGENMWHANAKILVDDIKAGKRYVTATPQEITEALAYNVPLLEPRQVRMLMRRGGQMGLFGRMGRRLNLLGADGVAGGKVLSVAESLKSKYQAMAAPMAAVIKDTRVRKSIINADTIEDLTPAAIRMLEENGISVDDFGKVKEAAELFDEALKSDDVASLLTDLTATVDGDDVVFLDSTGRSIFEALNDTRGPQRHLSGVQEWIYNGRYNAAETLVSGLTNLQSGLWKPLVMLRPAYVFRVLGEEQVRMWFNGYRSVLNSPMSFVALAMASRSRNPQRWNTVGRIFGANGPDIMRGAVDDIEEWLARSFGVARHDLDGHYLSQVEEFRDAMYRGRHNAMLRGEPETYMGTFEAVPFERVNGRVTDDTVNALAFDVMEASDRPMARLAAQAMFLDNHPNGPEAAKRLLLNSDDYAMLRSVWRWAGSPDPSPTIANRWDRGLSKAVLDGFSGDVSSPLFGYRAQAARTSEQLRGDMRNPTLARQHAETYFSRAMNTIGAPYARRGINGEGLVLNNGLGAETVLDQATYDSLLRASAQWPNERWWMMEVEEFNGPVGVMRPTPLGTFDYDEAILADFGIQKGVERIVLHGSPKPGVIGISKVNPSDEVIMQATVQVAANTDGSLRVVGIDSINASFYDDFNIGDTIMEAVEYIEPGFMARTTVGEFLDTPIAGRPLYEWFDDLNIATSPIGIEEFTGNPRWAKSSIDEILNRKIEGSEVRVIEYLTDPENFRMLPDEMQAKLLARRPDRFIDDGDVIRTADGDYALVEVGDGRVLDVDADGNLQVRDAKVAPEPVEPTINVNVKIQKQGKAGPATTTRIDDVVEAADAGPTIAYADDAADLAEEMAGPVPREPAPVEAEIVGGIDPGEYVDLDRFPEGASALLARGRGVIERRGESFAITSLGPSQQAILDDILSEATDPRLAKGVSKTGARSALIEDRAALEAALDAYPATTKAEIRSLERLKASVARAGGDRTPSIGVRRLRTGERGIPGGMTVDDATNRPLLGRWEAHEIDETVYEWLDAIEEKRIAKSRHMSNRGGAITKDVKRATSEDAAETIGKVPVPKDDDLYREDFNLVQRRVEGDLVRTSILTEDVAMAMHTVLTTDNPAWNASWSLVPQGRRAYLKIHDAEQFSQLLDSVWRGKEETWDDILNGVWSDRTLAADVEPVRLTAKQIEAARERVSGNYGQAKPPPDSLQKYLNEQNWKPGALYADDATIDQMDAIKRLDGVAAAKEEEYEILGDAVSWFTGKKAADWKPQRLTDMTPDQAIALRRMGWTNGRSGKVTQIEVPRSQVSNPGVPRRLGLGMRGVENPKTGKLSGYVAEVRDVDDAIARTKLNIERLSKYGPATPEGKDAKALKEWLDWLESNKDDLPHKTLVPPADETFTAAKKRTTAARQTIKNDLAGIALEKEAIDDAWRVAAVEGAAARDEVTEAFTAVTENVYEKGPRKLEGASGRTIKEHEQAGGRWSAAKDAEREFEQAVEGKAPKSLPADKYQAFSGPSGVSMRSLPRVPRHRQMVEGYLNDITRQIDEAAVPPYQHVVRLGSEPQTEWVEVPTGRFNIEIYDPGTKERVGWLAKELDEDTAIERTAAAMQRRAELRDKAMTGPTTGRQYVYRVREQTELREVNHMVGTNRSYDEAISDPQWVNEGELLPEERALEGPPIDEAAEADDALSVADDELRSEIAALEAELGGVEDQIAEVGALEGADTMADMPQVDRTIGNRNIRESDNEGIFEVTVPQNSRPFVEGVMPEKGMLDEDGLLTIRNYDVDDIADALEDAAETGYERNFAEKFRRRLEKERDLGNEDLPYSEAEHTWKEAKTPYEEPETPAPSAAPETQPSNRMLTGTLEHGGHKVKIDGNEVKTALINAKRPVEVEEAIGMRLLRLADEQGAPLTIKVSKPSATRRAQYEALGFTDEVASTKSSVTLRRNPDTPLPESWPRGDGQPVGMVDDADTLGGWVGVNEDGEIIVRGGDREEALGALRERVEANVRERGELSKDDLADIFRTMHESNPHRIARPEDVRTSLNRSGQSLVESKFKPRPGFTGTGEYVGPPRGTPRGYESIETGPLHYFPVSDQLHQWDMNLLELMGTGKAYGDVPEEIVEGMRVDPLTGRQIMFDLDEMRADAVSPRGKDRVTNQMNPWLRERSMINDWVPSQGRGRAVLRRPTKGHGQDPSRYRTFIDNAFDMITARPANLLSRGPVWHDAYMEALAELYPFASDGARQDIINYLRGEGLHGKNNEVWNLVASMLGKRKDMSAEQIEKMLLSQAREVQRVGWAKVGRVEIDQVAGVGAARRGIKTAEEVTMLAQQIAAERVKTLLFDAAQRNQFFEQYAIIFPFGDAFAELLSRWSRAFTTSPYRMRNLSRTGNVAKALNGGLYDDDGIYSQDAGLRYTDPYSGEDMILLPGSEWASQMVTGDPNAMKIGLNAGGLSPLSVSMIPGLGPVVTASAGAFGKFLGDLNPADPFRNPFLYRQLFPYGVYDPSTSGEGMGGVAQHLLGFPGWLNRLGTGVMNIGSDVAKARFGTPGGQRALENTAMEIMRVNAASGEWSLDTPQKQSEAAQMAFTRAAGIEIIRGLALGLFGANAPTMTIPYLDRDELASASDDEIDETLTYLAPVAYARIYQSMLDENEGDFLKTAVDFENKFGFNSAYVRTGKSVEVRPSPVSREGRLFFNENPDVVSSYPLAAYYLQPDPPGAEFNYEAFRLGIANGDRKTIDPREYADLLNNAVGLVEYQKKRDVIEQAQARGEISSTKATELIREVRLWVEREYPGFNKEASANKPDPRDVATELDLMVTHMDDLDSYQMGPVIRQAVELVRGAQYVSRDSGHGEWWWATSTNHPVAIEIRRSFRAAFDTLAQQDPRAAVLWNEVYSKIIPYGEPSRLKIVPDDPYFSGFFTADDYEVPEVDIDVPEAEVRQP